MSQSIPIKPLPFWKSLLLFGIPAIMTTLGIYVCIPALNRAGVPLFWNFFLFTAGPLMIMLLASFAAYRLEGHAWTWQGVKERFRLKPLQGKDWLWTVGLAVVYIDRLLQLRAGERKNPYHAHLGKRGIGASAGSLVS